MNTDLFGYFLELRQTSDGEGCKLFLGRQEVMVKEAFGRIVQRRRVA